MRVIISDTHLAFSESLAHVLTSRGARVIAVVQKVAEVAIVLSRQSVDVCVVGLGSDRSLAGERYAALATLTPKVAVVVLAETVTPALRAECAALAVRGLGDMRQGMSEVLRLLDRVRRGDQVLDPLGLPKPVASEDDVHRLAAFLSARERAVLTALVRGEDTGSLARTLGISHTTARGHVQGVLTKLGVHSRVAAVTLAVRGGLVDPATGTWESS